MSEWVDSNDNIETEESRKKHRRGVLSRSSHRNKGDGYVRQGRDESTKYWSSRLDYIRTCFDSSCNSVFGYIRWLLSEFQIQNRHGRPSKDFINCVTHLKFGIVSGKELYIELWRMLGCHGRGGAYAEKCYYSQYGRTTKCFYRIRVMCR